MVGAVDGFMDDSDESNIDRIGHRRWCLNPRMRRTGFGQAGEYAAMWSMDSSGPDPRDVEAVRYPPPGYVPVELFEAHYAWNFSPLDGRAPARSDVVVTIQPLGDYYLPAGEPLAIDYLEVAEDGYGGTPCVIFRPSALEVAPGKAYRCRLSFDEGRTTAFDYVVEFVSGEGLR